MRSIEGIIHEIRESARRDFECSDFIQNLDIEGVAKWKRKVADDLEKAARFAWNEIDAKMNTVDEISETDLKNIRSTMNKIIGEYYE